MKNRLIELDKGTQLILELAFLNGKLLNIEAVAFSSSKMESFKKSISVESHDPEDFKKDDFWKDYILNNKNNFIEKQQIFELFSGTETRDEVLESFNDFIKTNNPSVIWSTNTSELFRFGEFEQQTIYDLNSFILGVGSVTAIDSLDTPIPSKRMEIIFPLVYSLCESISRHRNKPVSPMISKINAEVIEEKIIGLLS